MDRPAAHGCDALEAEAASLPSTADIGAVAVLAELGYLDLRWWHEDWRAGRPGLAAWFERMSDRPSFRDTMPPGL